MTTTFNRRFPVAVVEQHFSAKGNLVRETVVAACSDRDAAYALYDEMRRSNPFRMFSFHVVC